jgi:hypothetical protein
MIAHEREIQQVLEQMERMLRSLFTLHAEVLPQSHQQFALMAEGPLAEIRRLEQELGGYIDSALQPLDGGAEPERAGAPTQSQIEAQV